MPMFKKQKKEETEEFKKQKKVLEDKPEVEDVVIETKNNKKDEVKEEHQPTLIDIVIDMPEVEYKAQVLALLSEILKKMDGGNENEGR